MNLEKLAFSLLKKQKEGKAISLSDWPNDILMNSKAWSAVRQISNFTNNEGMFTKREGTVGIEYAISA